MLKPEGNLSLKELKRRRLICKMVDKIFCPKCRSEDAQHLIGIGGFTGTYKCRDCGFSGVFPIKEIINRKKKIEGIKR